MFQSTLPHGERRGPCASRGTCPCFNPRSHTGSDIKSQLIESGFAQFQSTLPHGERPRAAHFYFSKPMFQSTLPHGERQGVAREDGLLIIVSIHAPTRGATSRNLTNFAIVLVSIHAPTRGATDFLLRDGIKAVVSIHAPTRGATSAARWILPR